MRSQGIGGTFSDLAIESDAKVRLLAQNARNE